jgi:hypothetical protein
MHITAWAVVWLVSFKDKSVMNLFFNLPHTVCLLQARRVVAGFSLVHALQGPSLVEKVVAAATMAVTAPLYALAQRLVFSKVWGIHFSTLHLHRTVMYCTVLSCAMWHVLRHDLIFSMVCCSTV